MFNSLIACAIYYYLWISVIPKLRGYRIRQEILRLEDGAQSHKLVKVPIDKLSEWDATHDAVGRLLNDSAIGSNRGSAGSNGASDEKKPSLMNELSVGRNEQDVKR